MLKIHGMQVLSATAAGNPWVTLTENERQVHIQHTLKLDLAVDPSQFSGLDGSESEEDFEAQDRVFDTLKSALDVWSRHLQPLQPDHVGYFLEDVSFPLDWARSPQKVTVEVTIICVLDIPTETSKNQLLTELKRS